MYISIYEIEHLTNPSSATKATVTKVCVQMFPPDRSSWAHCPANASSSCSETLYSGSCQTLSRHVNDPYRVSHPGLLCGLWGYRNVWHSTQRCIYCWCQQKLRGKFECPAHTKYRIWQSRSPSQLTHHLLQVVPKIMSCPLKVAFVSQSGRRGPHPLEELQHLQQYCVQTPQRNTNSISWNHM